MNHPKLATTNIALTGAAGIGKTTLASELAVALGKTLIDEHYDDHFQRKNIKEKTPKDWARELIAVLQMKTGLEKEHPGFITDRCALDLMALWCKYHLHNTLPKPDSDKFFKLCQQRVTHYDFFVIPPWDAFEMPQVDPTERPKVRRNSNLLTQMNYHCMLLGYVHLYIPKTRIIEIPRRITDLSERKTFVIATMEKRLAKKKSQP